MEEKLQILNEKAFELIKDESLPEVSKIKFLNSLSGTKKLEGNINKRQSSTETIYTIRIHTTTARFYNDCNGKFLNTSTGKRTNRAFIGTKKSFVMIVETLAHEIAHLKFWKHNVQHKSYTIYLNKCLVKKLKEVGVDIGGKNDK